MCHASEQEVISNCMKAVNVMALSFQSKLHARFGFSEKIKIQSLTVSVFCFTNAKRHAIVAYIYIYIYMHLFSSRLK